MASFQRDSAQDMSMREKSLVKRRINKEHNSNFRAGYVSINEEQLHKTGIRGRKCYIVFILVVLLVLLVIVNLIITLLMVGVLRMGREGMESMEFNPSGVLLRFLGDSDLGQVFPVRSTLGSLHQQSLEVSGTKGGQVDLKVQPDGSELVVGPDKTKLIVKDAFSVTDPETGRVLFSTDFHNHQRLPEAVAHIVLTEMVTDRVASDINQRLLVENTAGSVSMRGGEGLTASGKQLKFTAGQDLSLLANQTLELSGQKGIRLSQVSRGKIPIRNASLPVDLETETYKVCVCLPSGRLFAVPGSRSCQEANEDTDPCAA